MSNYDKTNKVGHPVAGIVLAILGIGIAVLFSLLFGAIATAVACVLGIVGVLLGLGARKGGRGMGAIVTGIVAVVVAAAMLFTTVGLMKEMHKVALETGKAPVFAECFDNPYLGISSVLFRVGGDEARQKALMDEMDMLRDYNPGQVRSSLSLPETPRKRPPRSDRSVRPDKKFFGQNQTEAAPPLAGAASKASAFIPASSGLFGAAERAGGFLDFHGER